MNKTNKKPLLRVRIILLFIVVVFLLLFVFVKGLRYSAAIRFLAVTSVDPFRERIHSVDIADDFIIIRKVFKTNPSDRDKTMSDLEHYEIYETALESSIKINEKIYGLQRLKFFCDSPKAVYINSDSYFTGGLTPVSVGTGHGSYEIGVEISAEGKWAIVRYLSKNVKKECEKIVSEYDNYEFYTE